MKENGKWGVLNNSGKDTRRRFSCYFDAAQWAIKKFGQRAYTIEWHEHKKRAQEKNHEKNSRKL
jgi:hypothetical protein